MSKDITSKRFRLPSQKKKVRFDIDRNEELIIPSRVKSQSINVNNIGLHNNTNENDKTTDKFILAGIMSTVIMLFLLVLHLVSTRRYGKDRPLNSVIIITLLSIGMTSSLIFMSICVASKTKRLLK